MQEKTLDSRCSCQCTAWVKKQDTKLLPITSPNVNRFSKFFHWQTQVINLQQNRISLFHRTLVKYECQKTGGNLKCLLWLIINHKVAQPSILSCDWLLHYKFITQFAREKILKIGEHLVKLQAKWLIVICPICLRLLSSKMQNSPDK